MNTFARILFLPHSRPSVRCAKTRIKSKKSLSFSCCASKSRNRSRQSKKKGRHEWEAWNTQTQFHSRIRRQHHNMNANNYRSEWGVKCARDIVKWMAIKMCVCVCVCPTKGKLLKLLVTHRVMDFHVIISVYFIYCCYREWFLHCLRLCRLFVCLCVCGMVFVHIFCFKLKAFTRCKKRKSKELKKMRTSVSGKWIVDWQPIPTRFIPDTANAVDRFFAWFSSLYSFIRVTRWCKFPINNDFIKINYTNILNETTSTPLSPSSVL